MGGLNAPLSLRQRIYFAEVAFDLPRNRPSARLTVAAIPSCAFRPGLRDDSLPCPWRKSRRARRKCDWVRGPGLPEGRCFISMQTRRGLQHHVPRVDPLDVDLRGRALSVEELERLEGRAVALRVADVGVDVREGEDMKPLMAAEGEELLDETLYTGSEQSG